MEIDKNGKRRIKILTALIFIILLLLYFTIDQKRDFYCLNDHKCFTVWKRIGGYSYIIPGKYYGGIKPSDYIKTNTSNSITIIYDKSSNYDFIIHNNYGKETWFDFPNYSVEYFPYDEFEDFVAKYYNENNEVKKDIKYLQIDIAENLIILNGEKIE